MNETTMKKLETIETMGTSARGKSELINHLNGKRLTRNQAIRAMCYDCTGFYADGRLECELSDCPLYGFMPYRGKKAVVEIDKD